MNSSDEYSGKRESALKEKQNNIVVLDGGFSTQLANHVTQSIDGDVLWTARFLTTNPEAIINTHLDFLRAGSDIITTDTYQASTSGFIKYLNLSELDSYNLIKSAVHLAQTACIRFQEEQCPGTNVKPIIAGSIGPYGAYLNDGSEYTGSYAKTVSAQTLRDWHKPRMDALIEGGVNLLALETIPCRSEAEVLVNLIKEYPQIKAWLTFSCASDGKSISNGENFQEVAKTCYDLNPEQILAIGINCTGPHLVESLITGINDDREDNPIPIIVYPNSGEAYVNFNGTSGTSTESVLKVKQGNIIIIDGGFSNQLANHVSEPIDGDDVLWAARFLTTNPEAIIDTHLDFLRAGCDVITTNTYQASTSGFVKYLNLSELDSYNLIKSAVSLAQQACSRFRKEQSPGTNVKPLIAGSIGPYGIHLNDGSEYTGAYAKTVSAHTMRDWHKPRMLALIEGGVNLLALETIPCLSEAVMLVDLIKEYPQIKAWLTFSCKDGKSIATGENFQEVAKRCYDSNPEQILAVGINCMAPHLVEPLIRGINDNRKDNPIPIITYPNSGEYYLTDKWLERSLCEPLHFYISKWLDLGVTYVGGCCRTSAEDITRIKEEVIKWQNNKNNA